MDADIIRLVADRKIREAMDEGKFDNLPGKGQPLVFEDDPLTPPHLRLANRILKNAGALPEWVQVQKDIDQMCQETTALRERLCAEHQERATRLAGRPDTHPEVQAFAVWHAKSRALYQRHLKSVNTAILKLSLLAPRGANGRAPYRIELEMAAFDARFPPPAPIAAEHEQAETPPESRLKSLAREAYRKKT
jgi:hypothetical protein